MFLFVCFVSSPCPPSILFLFQFTLAGIRPSVSFTECSPASSSGEAPPPPPAPPCPLTWRAAGCWGTTQTSRGGTFPTLARSSQQVCDQVSSSLPPLACTWVLSSPADTLCLPTPPISLQVSSFSLWCKLKSQIHSPFSFSMEIFHNPILYRNHCATVFTGSPAITPSLKEPCFCPFPKPSKASVWLKI